MKLLALTAGREWQDCTFLPLVFDNGKVGDVMVKTADLATRTAEFIKMVGVESAEWVLEDNGEYKGTKKYKVTGYPGKPKGAGGGKFGGGGGGGWKKDPEHLKFEQRCINRRTTLVQSVELAKLFPPDGTIAPDKYLEALLSTARKMDLYLEVTLTVPVAAKKEPDDLTTPKGATSETPAGQSTPEFGKCEPVNAVISAVDQLKSQSGHTYYKVRTPLGEFGTFSETLAAQASHLVGKLALVEWRANAKNPKFKDLVKVTAIEAGTGEVFDDSDIPF